MSMKFEDFIRDVVSPYESDGAGAPDGRGEREPSGEETPALEDLDVQKAVVESLAADKVVRDEEIARLKKEIETLRADLEDAHAELAGEREKKESLVSRVCELETSLAEAGDALTKDSDDGLSSRIALLERNIDCGDRFPGETRDHVLEAVREARDRAEADGRNRCAQVLEGVLAANEPNGTLARLRAELEKLFEANGNIVSGPVIEELRKRGLSHKHGEDYLLPSEIIKRAY